MPPDWWPFRSVSRCVEVGGTRWHLQRLPGPAADAPAALLLHGTGAATHTWRHLAPRLARRFEVLMVDLPGHGFTRDAPPNAFTLPGVAAALGDLVDHLGHRPALLIGHSAGAAIALRMALDGRVAPRLVVSINGALLPPQGPLGALFLPVARALAWNRLVPPVFAAWASLPAVTRRLLDSTGSRIDALGERCYAHLVSSPDHAAGALRLMASWDLAPLRADLPALNARLLLVAAAADRTVPPAQAAQVAAGLAQARVVTLPGLGHLAHEEDAAAVARPLLAAWDALARAAAPG
jgi:magnesium chelatase accessory protein